MSVKVSFEIGHKATFRKKRTFQGFTHDWEVFVQGRDSTDIRHFVKKVVFYLDETFPNPRRVVTESPYKISESGYGGFFMTIHVEVYLRNSEEPKKITIAHDLTLLLRKSTIKVQQKEYIFENPNEQFKQLLLRGGGLYLKPKTKCPKFKKSSKNLPKKPSEEDSQGLSPVY